MKPLTFMRLMAGAALLSLSTILAPAASAQQAPTPTTSVTITDSGFTPAAISVPSGATVTWTNTGVNVHTATSSGTVPATFDTGGIGPNQTGTWVFSTPG